MRILIFPPAQKTIGSVEHFSDCSLFSDFYSQLREVSTFRADIPDNIAVAVDLENRTEEKVEPPKSEEDDLETVGRIQFYYDDTKIVLAQRLERTKCVLAPHFNLQDSGKNYTPHDF